MLVDSHTHLQDRRFGDDYVAVLSRARAAGVGRMIVVGYDLPSSQAAVEMADPGEGLWAAVGVHPHDAKGADEQTVAELRELAGRPGVVALGEAGLDFYRDLSPRPVQQDLFRALIAVAREAALPLIVHSRNAAAETLELLAAEAGEDLTVVMHCFAGDRALAQECLRRGYYLGLAGPVTYPKSEELRAVAAEAPLDRLLLETDCPWLPPQEHRGERNEPAYVRLVGERVAELRGMSLAELAAATSENAARVFGIR